MLVLVYFDLATTFEVRFAISKLAGLRMGNSIFCHNCIILHERWELGLNECKSLAELNANFDVTEIQGLLKLLKPFAP